MREERREVLTYERVRAILMKELVSGGLWFEIVLVVFFTLMALLFLWVTWTVQGCPQILRWAISVVGVAAAGSLLGGFTYSKVSVWKIIRNNAFDVVEDELCYITEHEAVRRYKLKIGQIKLGGYWGHRTAMHFANHGCYEGPEYRTASAGDRFYVVVYHRDQDKIVRVFSTKRYVYRET